MAKIIIDPLTRVSGVLGIEVEIKGNQIVDARCKGNQFRGFERMFQGRDPLDIIWLSSRVCGICSTHHALTSTLAIENALGVDPDFNGKLAREIANGFEFLQNHLRQLYLFAFPDYVEVSNLNPVSLSLTPEEADYRLTEKLTAKINEDIKGAITNSRLAHRAIAMLTGKVPHGHGIFVGGITAKIDIQDIEGLEFTVKVIKEYVQKILLEDINIISDYYKDYFELGRGYGNFMDGGVFADYEGTIKYAEPGVMINGIRENLNVKNITENVHSSWLESKTEYLIPGVDQPPMPNAYKKQGYSWVVSPRYKGYALEGGPLARMTINGYYHRGISAMDRLTARGLELEKICESIEGALKLLKIGEPFQKQWEIPLEGKGVGISGASRGTLGHWISIKDKKVANYTLVTPSQWNLSPMDNKGVKGPVETALIGTKINNVKSPVEIGRIVRSFDPCLNCGAHVISDSYEPFTIDIV